MMITAKDIKHVAELARIGINKNEEEIFRKELSSIFGYVERLKKIDLSGVEPTSHPFLVKNVMRKDEAGKEKNKLLEGFLKVKSIFK